MALYAWKRSSTTVYRLMAVNLSNGDVRPERLKCIVIDKPFEHLYIYLFNYNLTFKALKKHWKIFWIKNLPSFHLTCFEDETKIITVSSQKQFQVYSLFANHDGQDGASWENRRLVKDS